MYNYVFTVIKVERLSDEIVNKGYVFPDEDDDLTDYKGKHAQLMIPSGLLQDIISMNAKICLKILSGIIYN